ncbi:MAG: UpxY family transcription antiterminator [Ignavibacterium sp.]|nr:UpxY family transcription antiterminator [Ignavibacterium sp.]
MEEKKFWYVLYTKPRQEKKAKEQLDKISIENYLPLVKKKNKWSDRYKIVDEVIIKSYIFIFCSEKERIKALELSSIVRCLFDRGKPAIIPEWQMENFRKFIEKASDVFVYEGIPTGRKVLIIDGPFAGIIGTIQKCLNKNYFSVTLDFVNRSVTTIIPEKDLKIIEIFDEDIKDSDYLDNKLYEKFLAN